MCGNGHGGVVNSSEWLSAVVGDHWWEWAVSAMDGAELDPGEVVVVVVFEEKDM